MTEYLQVLTDRAHILAEATFIAIELVLLTPVVRWLHTRWVKRHDAEEHDA